MILSIDIGGTRFRVAVAKPDGTLVKVVRRSTDTSGGAEWMIEQVESIADDLIGTYPVKAIGVGFGGPVDYSRQRIVNSTHVPGWDNVPLPGLLESRFGLPAIVDNDANVGALGETTYGAGKGLKTVVYYTISTGIGGGVIIDGSIYRGANGNAGELGHVPILKEGPVCACGNSGCLEALCSGPAIGRRGGRRLKRRGMTAREVFDEARAGNRDALQIVSDTVTYLSMGIASTINAFAPEAVIVGGGVSRAGKTLFEPLRQAVTERVMPVHRSDVRILQAKRGDNAVLLGGVALAGE